MLIIDTIDYGYILPNKKTLEGNHKTILEALRAFIANNTFLQERLKAFSHFYASQRNKHTNLDDFAVCYLGWVKIGSPLDRYHFRKNIIIPRPIYYNDINTNTQHFLDFIYSQSMYSENNDLYKIETTTYCGNMGFSNFNENNKDNGINALYEYISTNIDQQNAMRMI